jgi:hypothetical protein
MARSITAERRPAGALYRQIATQTGGPQIFFFPAAGSSAESLCSASFRLRGLFLSILRRRVGFERMEKTGRDGGYFIDGSLE